VAEPSAGVARLVRAAEATLAAAAAAAAVATASSEAAATTATARVASRLRAVAGNVADLTALEGCQSITLRDASIA
jgi:cell pole-organizing protein PopZ